MYISMEREANIPFELLTSSLRNCGVFKNLLTTPSWLAADDICLGIAPVPAIVAVDVAFSCARDGNVVGVVLELSDVDAVAWRDQL